MKAFHFRLQRYLELKQQEEKMGKLLLLQSRQEYRRQLAHLGETDQELQTLREARRRMGPEAVRSGYLVCAEQYHQTMLTKREAQRVAVSKAAAKVEETLGQVLTLQRQEKLLGKLRERRWSAYRRYLLAEEQKELDELSAARYRRPGEEF